MLFQAVALIIRPKRESVMINVLGAFANAAKGIMLFNFLGIHRRREAEARDISLD